MIRCNPKVYIESGNGSVESCYALSEEGFGVLFINEREPAEVGITKPIPEDFDYKNSAITWVFKSIKSLDVMLMVLNKLRSDMEAFENGDFDWEET